MPKPDQLSDEEILVKHAFRGSSFAVVRLEELTEIGNLKADAVSCYRPVNAQELFAVERIALCQQKILRGERLESGLFTTALDYCLEPNGRIFRPMDPELIGDGEITHAQNRNFAAGEGLRIMVIESEVWSILLRYQVNADRQYRRAIEDFERLKRLRPEMPNHPNIGAAPDVIDDMVEDLHEISWRFAKPAPTAGQPAAPAAETFLETPAASPDAGPDSSPDAPEDGAPLAPAAASTSTPRMPASRIPASAAHESTRLKVKPLADLPRLRRSNKPRRRPASLFHRPACRPLANPAVPPHSPEPPGSPEE